MRDSLDSSSRCKILQARVVQKVENAIQGIAWFVLWTLVHWITIYPGDSVILPFYNWDQNCNSSCKLFIVRVCEIRYQYWRAVLAPASCIWEMYMNAFRFSCHLWHSLKRCNCQIDNSTCPIVNSIVTNTRFSSSPSTKLFWCLTSTFVTVMRTEYITSAIWKNRNSYKTLTHEKIMFKFSSILLGLAVRRQP